MINLKISCASVMYTSNLLQRISRMAIARLMQDLYDIEFKDAIQVYINMAFDIAILKVTFNVN